LENFDKIWQEYQKTKSPKLREKLITSYAHIVKHVAGRMAIYLGQQMDFDDLISYGIFGLIDAIDKFDMLKGVKFETYASLRIRGAIIDGVRNMDWVPRTLRQQNKKFGQSYVKLEAELGREPTEQEISKALSISVEEVRESMNKSSVMSLVSLDDYMEQNSSFDLGQDEDTPEGYFNKKELQELLTNSIEKLNEKERLIVTLHYFEDLTLREISKIVKVSESRVSQIHTKALLKMQGSLSKFKYVLFS